MRLRTVVLAALILTWPMAAEAQRGRGPADRNELTVFAGVSLTNPESTDPDRRPILVFPEIGFVPGPFLQSASLDGSAEFGVRYTRRWTDTLKFGGDFSIAPSHELTETTGFGCPPGRFCIATDVAPLIFVPEIQLKTRVVAYHYGANIGIDLTEGTLRPEVIAGVGGVTYDVEQRRHTEFALRVGAALVAETGRLNTRLEIVDVITSDHFVTGRAEHDVHVRVGFGVRW